MQFPLIHLNGTCGDDLLADQCDIARALRDALEVNTSRRSRMTNWR